MKENRTNEEIMVTGQFYDEKQTQVTLDGLSTVSKEVKQDMAFVDDNQIRLIIDQYYQAQACRIGIKNQIRAVAQNFDEVPEGENGPAVAWLSADVENRENQIKKMIAEYVKHNPICSWVSKVKGIGPVFAANLWSYIDMSKCNHATQFLSYAGLNDNNCPWLGKEKAKKIVEDAYEKFGKKTKEPLDDHIILEIAINSGRNVPGIKRMIENHRAKYGKKENDSTVLIKCLSKPPYNTELKKMCYLIGESFVKVSNRGSLYGRIYQERKALETARNENGEYAEQAAKLLAEKNYDKSTDTYKCLSQGKLSPAHINQRAERYATKIFLTHFFEAAWIYTHQTNPPQVFAIAHQGHVDYIEPEVPYDELWRK